MPRRVSALCDILEQDILTGTLRPGVRLEEAVLAGRFGVSRTPVREALTQLAAMGLITRRPRRGAVVSEIGAAALAEMFEVMALLEGQCARLAAQRISRQGRHDLQDAYLACADAADRGNEDAYYYENERFHQAIYDHSANAFLANQTRQLRNRLKPYRRMQLRQHDRLVRSLDEHKRITEAILAGNAALAQQIMFQHIAVQGELSGAMHSARRAKRR